MLSSHAASAVRPALRWTQHQANRGRQASTALWSCGATMELTGHSAHRQLRTGSALKECGPHRRTIDNCPCKARCVFLIGTLQRSHSSNPFSLGRMPLNPNEEISFRRTELARELRMVVCRCVMCTAGGWRVRFWAAGNVGIAWWCRGTNVETFAGSSLHHVQSTSWGMFFIFVLHCVVWGQTSSYLRAVNSKNLARRRARKRQVEVSHIQAPQQGRLTTERNVSAASVLVVHRGGCLFPLADVMFSQRASMLSAVQCFCFSARA